VVASFPTLAAAKRACDRKLAQVADMMGSRRGRGRKSQIAK
jgi:hypothetical protein